jgi:hypothetical protein
MPKGIFLLEYRGSKLLFLNRVFGAHDCTSVWDSMTDSQDPAQDRPARTSTKRKDEAIATTWVLRFPQAQGTLSAFMGDVASSSEGE